MQQHTNLKKYLFGGAFVAAGLMIHEAHAQDFVFIDSNATSNVMGYGNNDIDTFSGPGPWGVSSYLSDGFWIFGDAYASGTSTGLYTYVWGGGYDSVLSVDSRFTTTSNALALLCYTAPTYSDAFTELTITDLTTGAVLLSVNDDVGRQVFELLSEHEYRFLYSGRNYSFVNLTIPCSAADLDGDGNVNYYDVSLFLNFYQQDNLAADFTGDGQINFFDVSDFLGLYAAGCP